MDVLRRALEVSPPEAASLRAWWDATAAERARFSTTIDRAIIGGALADRIGFAFAGGYHEALQQLVPGLQGNPASLCATEDGGNHPRAIKTSLTRKSDWIYALNGKKSWATSASDSTQLLVIASTGEANGKNQLVLCSVRAGSPGVTLTTTNAPFVPEIPHASVTFDNVSVTEADIHTGDGYDDYLKPFRTIEDIHVHGALLGYALGICRRRNIDLLPAIAAALTTARSLEDPKSPVTHLALAGLIEQTTRIVAELEARWAPDEEVARWQRDRALFKVASSARTARLARAKQELGL